MTGEGLSKGKLQEQEMKALVGECLHNWSNIELELSHLFVAALKAERPYGYIAWDSFINFKDKLGCVNNLLEHRKIEDAELREFWARLSNRISSASVQRNEVAHAAYLGNSHESSLVPFLSIADVLTRPRDLKKLTPNNLRNRASEFVKIQYAIQWFATIFLSEPDSKDVLSMPDLVMEIRAQISQRPTRV